MLSNRRIQITDLEFLNSSPVDIQQIPISRGSGSSVVRTRNKARNITVSGGVTLTNYTADNDSVLYMSSDVNKIFNQQNRYLRTVPKDKVTVLDSCQATTGWVGSDDATSVVLDTANFEWESASVGFSVNVATSGNNFATLTKTLAVPVDLSAFTDRGNFEFSLNLDDVYYITSIDFRTGNRLRNILARTDDLDNSGSWTAINGLTVSTPDVDGFYTITDGTSSFSGLQQVLGVIASGQSYTFSITAKQGTNSNLVFLLSESASPFTTQFTTTFVLTGTETRYTITGVNTSANSVRAVLRVGTGAGINEGTVLVKDPQLETGTIATPYQVQSGATATQAYYSTSFTTNYEGKALENGVNYFSVPWGNDVQGKVITETGAVVDTAIDYLYIRINYSSSASDFTGNLNFFGHIQENFVRNYPCYSQGGVNWNPSWTQNVGNISNDFSVTLLNNTGYGIATHDIQLFNVTGITSASSTQTVDLNGNLDPQISNVFKLNTVTNLNDLRYRNLNTNEEIRWTNTWVANDQVRFDKLNTIVTRNGLAQDFSGKLPNSVLGKNRLQMSVVTNGSGSVSQLLSDTSTTVQGVRLNFPSYAGDLLAQSFTVPTNAVLNEVILSLGVDLFPRGANVIIYSDTAGNPGTQLAIYTGTITSASTTDTSFLPSSSGLSLTSATTYWIVLFPTSVTSGTIPQTTWARQSTAPYANGVAKQNINNAGWTSVTGDFRFTVNYQPTPSTNIDWTATYKPLYL
jgi:hypothetical protein